MAAPANAVSFSEYKSVMIDLGLAIGCFALGEAYCLAKIKFFEDMKPWERKARLAMATVGAVLTTLTLTGAMYITVIDGLGHSEDIAILFATAVAAATGLGHYRAFSWARIPHKPN